MDVNELRSDEIMIHHLYGVEDEYTFFYDETNNIRKFRLIETGFNVDNPGNFVLGGVAHKGRNSQADFKKLFGDLRLPGSVKEIKRKHIGVGGFWDLLEAKKLETFLSWLGETDLYIHYFNLDVVYWSLIDIVESVLDSLDEELLLGHMELKSDVAKVLLADQRVFLDAVTRLNYPNIKRDDFPRFKYWISKLVKRNIRVLDSYRAERVLRFLELFNRATDLPFLVDEEDKILIKDFSPFYLKSQYLFKNSFHVFDTELAVEASLENIQLTERGIPLQNRIFVDSKNEVGVQVSDVVSGLLGKYFTEVRSSDVAALRSRERGLSQIGKTNLAMLRAQMAKSLGQSNAFFHAVATEDERNKHAFFMYECAGA